MDRTTDYAKLIVSGGKLCGRAEYLACKRHLDDMSRKNFPYKFDAQIAENHIELANELTIGEGNNPRRLKTRGFQDFIIGSLFGWRKKKSSVRRFREAYIQMARQNGKSFIAGEMCNDFATFSGYQYGRIFCAATKMDQAKIVFDEVVKFIESDSCLNEMYKIRKYDSTITSLATGTTIKAIGRDTKTADGFRSILSVADELHAHPNNQMYKLLIDGQINVDNSLMLAITTAGFSINSFCHEHYQFCKKVLAGAIEKDSLFIFITELDEGDDIWNPENWAKANPLLLWNEDNTLNKEMLARMADKAIDAKEKQGNELVNFLTKSLNQWVTWTGSSWLDAEKWRACACDTKLANLRGRECYLGIDLSSGGDLTSIALVFPPPSDDDKIYVWSVSFMPELRVEEHEKTDDAPYRLWATSGQLILTSGMYGRKTDYLQILATLNDLIAEHDLKIIGCGYDVHNIAGILAELETILPCDLTEISQSARSLSDATQDFKLSVEAGLIRYDKQNSLLTWSMVNAILNAPNSFGEVKIDKATQVNRIDPCDAIIDAYKLYFEDKNCRRS
ncbi:MAG: terminase large subunit, partial [Selenomonadaceae bacterium]|nr:terminase large subunit [Selenomonadaceae bacterium]